MSKKILRDARTQKGLRVTPGAAPGTLNVDPRAPKPKLHVIAWGPDQDVTEADVHAITEIAPYAERYRVTWVNVDGLGDAETLIALADLLGVHRLALEDVINVPQRPKYEEYPDGGFFVLRMPVPTAPLDTEQVSLYLTDRVLVTFQERLDQDCLERVRLRIRGRGPRLMDSGPDYLAYAVIDAIVDAYFPVLEAYGDRLEEIENEILVSPDDDMLNRLHELKTDLSSARRIAFALREAVGTISRDESPLVTANTRLYLRDCHDHAIVLLDLIESYRDAAMGLMDFYLSSVSHRMNEVMKVLTIIATIFIPLSFFAGLYGMNFEHMPELSLPWAYPALLVAMAILAGGMLWVFWRRKWL